MDFHIAQSTMAWFAQNKVLNFGVVFPWPLSSSFPHKKKPKKNMKSLSANFILSHYFVMFVKLIIFQYKKNEYVKT